MYALVSNRHILAPPCDPSSGFSQPPLLKGPSLIQYEGYSFVLDLFTVFFSKNSSKYLETIVPKLAKENNAHKKEEFQVETDENNI